LNFYSTTLNSAQQTDHVCGCCRFSTQSLMGQATIRLDETVSRTESGCLCNSLAMIYGRNSPLWQHTDPIHAKATPPSPTIARSRCRWPYAPNTCLRKARQVKSYSLSTKKVRIYDDNRVRDPNECHHNDYVNDRRKNWDKTLSRRGGRYLPDKTTRTISDTGGTPWQCKPMKHSSRLCENIE